MNTTTAVAPAAASTGSAVAQAGQDGDLDIQIATAKRFPRDEVAVVNKIGALATIDENTAAACMYFVPRAGGYITGYSIRFAELCGACWGNMRVASRILPRQGKTAHAQSVCWDLETNFSWTSDAKMTARFQGGEELAEAAAQSISARNAVLRVVPQGVLRTVRDQVKATVLGNAKDMEEFRAKIVAAFKSHGVTVQHLEQWVGRTDPKGKPKESRVWTQEDLYVLRTLIANIRNGERSTKDEFGVDDKLAGKRPAKSTTRPDETGLEAPDPDDQVGTGDESAGDVLSGSDEGQAAPTKKAELVAGVRAMEADLVGESFDRVCEAFSVSNFDSIETWSNAALSRLWKSMRAELVG